MDTEPQRGRGGKRAGAGRKRELDGPVMFLAAFRVNGNISESCRIAGIDRMTFRGWLKQEEFAAAFEDARLEAIDNLEAEARRRAYEGVPRLKFNSKTGQPYMVPDPSGEMVPDPFGAMTTNEAGQKSPVMVPKMIPYVEREYSDQLLLRLLEANSPAKWAPRNSLDLRKLDDQTILRLLSEEAGG